MLLHDEEEYLGRGHQLYRLIGRLLEIPHDSLDPFWPHGDRDADRMLGAPSLRTLLRPLPPVVAGELLAVIRFELLFTLLPSWLERPLASLADDLAEKTRTAEPETEPETEPKAEAEAKAKAQAQTQTDAKNEGLCDLFVRWIDTETAPLRSPLVDSIVRALIQALVRTVTRPQLEPDVMVESVRAACAREHSRRGLRNDEKTWERWISYVGQLAGATLVTRNTTTYFLQQLQSATDRAEAAYVVLDATFKRRRGDLLEPLARSLSPSLSSSNPWSSLPSEAHLRATLLYPAPYSLRHVVRELWRDPRRRDHLPILNQWGLARQLQLQKPNLELQLAWDWFLGILYVQGCGAEIRLCPH